MEGIALDAATLTVALLAEGVDRNPSSAHSSPSCSRSPSSRRAWIEIMSWRIPCSSELVALLAEGVDRNFLGFMRIFG